MPIATGAAQIEAENNQLFMPVAPPLVFPGNQKLPNGKTPGYVPTLEEEAKAADKGKPINGGDADGGLLVNFGDQVKEFGEKVADRGMQALCQANPLACVFNVIMQAGKDASIPTGNGAKGVTLGADSAINGLELNKSLASQQQLSDLAAGSGLSIAGNGAKVPLRDASRLSSEYGGNLNDWSKVSSGSYTAIDGTQFEIHAYRNVVTGQFVEPKTIVLKVPK